MADNVPKDANRPNLNQLKVEAAAANAVSDHKIGPLTSQSTPARGYADPSTDFSSGNKFLFGVMPDNTNSVEVDHHKNGSQTVIIRAETDGTIMSGYENGATRVVEVDPQGHATLDSKDSKNYGSGPRAAQANAIADDMAKKIVTSVNSGAPQKMKTAFSGYKP